MKTTFIYIAQSNYIFLFNFKKFYLKLNNNWWCQLLSSVFVESFAAITNGRVDLNVKRVTVRVRLHRSLGQLRLTAVDHDLGAGGDQLPVAHVHHVPAA